MWGHFFFKDATLSPHKSLISTQFFFCGKKTHLAESSKMLHLLHSRAAIFLLLPWQRYEATSPESCKPCEEDIKSANHSFANKNKRKRQSKAFSQCATWQWRQIILHSVQLRVGPQAEVDAGQPLCHAKQSRMVKAAAEAAKKQLTNTEASTSKTGLPGLEESRSMCVCCVWM